MTAHCSRRASDSTSSEGERSEHLPGVHADNQAPRKVEPRHGATDAPDEQVREQGRHDAVGITRVAGMKPKGGDHTVADASSGDQRRAVEGRPGGRAVRQLEAARAQILPCVPGPRSTGAEPAQRSSRHRAAPRTAPARRPKAPPLVSGPAITRMGSAASFASSMATRSSPSWASSHAMMTQRLAPGSGPSRPERVRRLTVTAQPRSLQRVDQVQRFALSWWSHAPVPHTRRDGGSSASEAITTTGLRSLSPISFTGGHAAWRCRRCADSHRPCTRRQTAGRPAPSRPPGRLRIPADSLREPGNVVDADATHALRDDLGHGSVAKAQDSRRPASHRSSNTNGQASSP